MQRLLITEGLFLKTKQGIGEEEYRKLLESLDANYKWLQNSYNLFQQGKREYYEPGDSEPAVFVAGPKITTTEILSVWCKRIVPLELKIFQEGSKKQKNDYFNKQETPNMEVKNTRNLKKLEDFVPQWNDYLSNNP